MALGLTQPLTEMSIRNISWEGKGGRCLGLTILPPLIAVAQLVEALYYELESREFVSRWCH
jgi:hypothetical protein